ncbi:MAG: tripartite tricarboxylate transporter substrate binding protein, partial [Curvibacter sp.]|nr:tripartite tricarboxylate transporter substrate binding protein [Curvibacter sp.]
MRHEIPLRCRRSALAAVCLLGLWAGAQAADAWPARPVTLVVPFPAGGTTDLTGRALARALARLWGQPVVVENRAGAGGTVGASVVMRAAPDGYTLLLGTPADQVNAPLLMSRAPYDPAQAFAPAGCISRGPNVLVVNAKVPVRSVDELIRLAKAQPGKLHFASAGNGNTSHLSGELFSQTAGIDLAHVPYRGNSPAAIDVMGGQVEMMFSSPASVRPHIQSGALRVLAVTSDRRVPGFPDTPTLRESGLAMDIYSWSC